MRDGADFRQESFPSIRFGELSGALLLQWRRWSKAAQTSSTGNSFWRRKVVLIAYTTWSSIRIMSFASDDAPFAFSRRRSRLGKTRVIPIAQFA